jgi:hypothetical protein
MKNIQNWGKFNESYNQEMINEGLIDDLIKLPSKIFGFLLKPLVPLLLKIVGKTISIERKWKIVKSILDSIAKIAVDVEEAKKKLSTNKEVSSLSNIYFKQINPNKSSVLTPNERRELQKKVDKFKKEYPNGFKFSEVKKELTENLEKNFAKATNDKKKEDLEWILKKVSDYKISKTVSGYKYKWELLDDLIIESVNEGVAEKSVRTKDKHTNIKADKKDAFRKKLKDIIESNKDCKTKQVGDDLEIHCCDEHIGQVMFRSDYIGVKKMGNKFPKEFGYDELGKIKAEINSIIKSCK